MILRLLLCLPFFLSAVRAEEPTRAEVEEGLLRAAKFLREKVAVHGTYLWQYSADLTRREGEGKASTTQGWVQPPGTPSVGMAYLIAWEVTTNAYLLEAAQETAHALIRGQLRSGGWAHSMELDPNLRRKFAYREGGGETGRNVTTFDDDSTQAAVRFLMRADAALTFSDAKIRESIQVALRSILKAQYTNGAWPQGYDRFPNPQEFPVKPASYPNTWSRTWPGSQQYWLRYTLNDNNHATLVDTLFAAARTYANSADAEWTALARECHQAAQRAGDFLILAQMPQPQPAWAQQYDFDMHPAWARKFEPPAITAGESHGALRTLLQIYRETGNPKYLVPIPEALAYLRQSRLPNGRLARFYELQSNKPLYFTRDYQLTYDDSDLPTHYGFKVSDQTDEIAREYTAIRQLQAADLARFEPQTKKAGAREVKQILGTLDEHGRWVEPGPLRYHGPNDSAPEIIRCATFARNMEALADYLRQMRREMSGSGR